MEGREKQSTLRAGMARKSLSQYRLMGSAPKKMRRADTTPMRTLRTMALRRTAFTDFLVPVTSSSVTRRVTAVQMPEVAKVLPST